MRDRPKIRVGFPTLVFFVLLFSIDFDAVSLLPFAAALVHESGHLCAMFFSGEKVSGITVLPFGIDIKKKPSLSSYKSDIITASAGIAANLTAASVCALLPAWRGKDVFILSNLLLIVINILPVKGLDGGQVIERLIDLKFGPGASDRILGVTSAICILLLGGASIWLFLYTSYNYTLLLMCAYLFCGIFLK